MDKISDIMNELGDEDLNELGEQNLKSLLGEVSSIADDDASKLSNESLLRLKHLSELKENKAYGETLKAKPASDAVGAFGRSAVTGFTAGVAKQDPLQTKADKEEFPTASFAGDMAGAMTSPINLAGPVAGPMTYGAIRGYSESQKPDMQGKLNDAAGESVLGGVLSKAIPFAAKGVGEAVDYAKALIPGATDVNSSVPPSAKKWIANQSSRLYNSAVRLNPFNRDATMLPSESLEAIQNPTIRQQTRNFDKDAAGKMLAGRAQGAKDVIDSGAGKYFETQNTAAAAGADPALFDAKFDEFNAVLANVKKYVDMDRNYSAKTRGEIDSTLRMINKGEGPSEEFTNQAGKFFGELPKEDRFKRMWNARKYIDSTINYDKRTPGSAAPLEVQQKETLRDAISEVLRTSPQKRAADDLYSRYKGVAADVFEPITYKTDSGKFVIDPDLMLQSLTKDTAKTHRFLSSLDNFEKFVVDNRDKLEHADLLLSFAKDAKKANQQAGISQTLDKMGYAHGPSGLAVMTALYAENPKYLLALPVTSPSVYLKTLDNIMGMRSQIENGGPFWRAQFQSYLKLKAWMQRNPQATTSAVLAAAQRSGLPEELLPTFERLGSQAETYLSSPGNIPTTQPTQGPLP